MQETKTYYLLLINIFFLPAFECLIISSTINTAPNPNPRTAMISGKNDKKVFIIYFFLVSQDTGIPRLLMSVL